VLLDRLHGAARGFAQFAVGRAILDAARHLRQTPHHILFWNIESRLAIIQPP
jgi:hypothetical protein